MLTEISEKKANYNDLLDYYVAFLSSDVVNVSVIFLRLLRNIGQKNLR